MKPITHSLVRPFLLPGSLLLALCALCLSGCAEPYDALSHNISWTGEIKERQVGTYDGSDVFGIGCNFSELLQDELQKATESGKQAEFLDAIMGFAAVKDVKVTETDRKKHTTHSVMTLFPLSDRSREAQGHERFRSVIANDAKVYLDGQPAELQALTSKCVASFWGQDMHYETSDSGDQEITGVTLIIALTPDKEH